MTLQTAYAPEVKTCDGVAHIYNFAFKTSKPEYVKAGLQDPATGAITAGVYNVDYTVSLGTPLPAAGSITWATGGDVAGKKLVIWRASTPIEQLSSFDPAKAFSSGGPEAAFDLLTLMMQEMSARIDRCYRIPDGDALATTPAGPDVVARAGKLFGWDGSGNLVPLAGTGGALVSAAMGPVLAAATLALAQQALGVREVLTANRTYAVPGNFATLQAAADHIFNKLDLNGFNVQVSVADGTYTAGVTIDRPQVGDGYISFVGNTTTPANCFIDVTSKDCFYAGGGASIQIAGFKLRANTAGFLVHAGGIGGDGTPTTMGGITGGVAIIGKMEYASVANSYGHLYADFGGVIQMGNASYDITGGGGAHLWCEDGGKINEYHGGTPVATLTGVLAFAEAFAVADAGGIIRTSPTKTYTGGTITGSRYRAGEGGSIRFFTNSPDTYFPGNSPGLYRNGGTTDVSPSHSGTALEIKNLRQHKQYRIRIWKLKNATTDDDTLHLTASTDNGSSYVATNYQGFLHSRDQLAGDHDAQQSAAAQLTVLSAVPRSNGATLGEIEVNISGCAETGEGPSIRGHGSAGRTNSERWTQHFAGTLQSVNVNAVRFRLSDTTAGFSCRYRVEEIG